MGPDLQVTFLGTGTSQGVPVIACECGVCNSSDPRDQRLRTSIMLSKGEQNWVIDAGPDFRQQMLRAGVKRLDGVVFTHEHKDHLAGLDDIRAFNYFQQSSIPVYATERVQEAIRREFSYIFSEERYPGIPQLHFETIAPYQPFEPAPGLELFPMEVMHLRLPVLAFRFHNMAYVTDANHIPDACMNHLHNLDVLVLNALRREPHPSHFTLSEALDLTEQLKPQRCFFTHISHQLGRHAEVLNELPNGVSLAFDGLELIV